MCSHKTQVFGALPDKRSMITRNFDLRIAKVLECKWLLSISSSPKCTPSPFRWKILWIMMAIHSMFVEKICGILVASSHFLHWKAQSSMLWPRKDIISHIITRVPTPRIEFSWWEHIIWVGIPPWLVVDHICSCRSSKNSKMLSHQVMDACVVAVEEGKKNIQGKAMPCGHLLSTCWTHLMQKGLFETSVNFFS